MLISENMTYAVKGALLDPWFIGLLIAVIAVVSMIRYSRSFTPNWPGRSLGSSGLVRKKPIGLARTLWPWHRASLAVGHHPVQFSSLARLIKYRQWETCGTGDPANTTGRQWQRLTDILGAAADRNDRIFSNHSNAKIKLDAAELSFNRLLAEMSKVMPAAVDPSRSSGAFSGLQRSPAAQEPIAA